MGLGDALVGEPEPGEPEPGGPEPGGPEPGEPEPGEPEPGEPDAPGPGALPPGSRCACDADCADQGGQAGVCVTGICMIRASDPCASQGSAAECPDGLRCWPIRNQGNAPVCWPDCEAFACEGTCDGDGSCAPGEAMNCDAACGELCTGDGTDRPCGADNPSGYCDEGAFCEGGRCTGLCSPEHPAGICGQGFECQNGACVPLEGCGTWECDLGQACDDIVPVPGVLDPQDPAAVAAGYYIDTRREYAYLRRDLVMLLQWSTCQMRERFPEIGPLGLADLTQADGRIPGSDVGNTRHPSGTHDGSDLDLAYYQTDGLSDAQIICGDGSDDNPNGTRGRYNDGEFCTTEQNIVDIEQQVFFMALMAQHPGWRIVGIDVTLADDVEEEVARLRSSGVISPVVRDRLQSLGYGRAGGWQFHHHHIHVSYFD